MLQQQTRYFLAIALALCLAGCGKSVKPEPVADEPVVSSAPSKALAEFQQGLDAMAAGDDARAIAKFEALVRDHPEMVGSFVNLGIAYRRNGQVPDAEAALKRAVEVCNLCLASAWNELGILYREQGRFGEAESAYRQSIQSNPQFAPAYLNLGVLNDLYQRRMVNAIENYERFAELSDDDEASARVERWIVDIRRRVAAAETAAVTEETIQ